MYELYIIAQQIIGAERCLLKKIIWGFNLVAKQTLSIFVSEYPRLPIKRLPANQRAEERGIVLTFQTTY